MPSMGRNHDIQFFVFFFSVTFMFTALAMAEHQVSANVYLDLGAGKAFISCLSI